MNSLMTFLISTMAIIATLIGVAVLIFLLYKKDKVKEDNPLVINFLSKHSEGRALGIYKESEAGKDGRERIIMSPRDIDFNKMEDVKDVAIITQTSKVLNFSKGQWSKDRNLKVILPANAEDFEKSFTETPFGRMMAFYVEVDNADKNVKDAMEKGFQIQAQYMKELGHGEVSIKMMNQLSNIFKDTLKLQGKDNKGSGSLGMSGGN